MSLHNEGSFSSGGVAECSPERRRQLAQYVEQCNETEVQHLLSMCLRKIPRYRWVAPHSLYEDDVVYIRGRQATVVNNEPPNLHWRYADDVLVRHRNYASLKDQLLVDSNPDIRSFLAAGAEWPQTAQSPDPHYQELGVGPGHRHRQTIHGQRGVARDGSTGDSKDDDSSSSSSDDEFGGGERGSEMNVWESVPSVVLQGPVQSALGNSGGGDGGYDGFGDDGFGDDDGFDSDPFGEGGGTDGDPFVQESVNASSGGNDPQQLQNDDGWDAFEDEEGDQTASTALVFKAHKQRELVFQHGQLVVQDSQDEDSSNNTTLSVESNNASSESKDDTADLRFVDCQDCTIVLPEAVAGVTLDHCQRCVVTTSGVSALVSMTGSAQCVVLCREQCPPRVAIAQCKHIDVGFAQVEKEGSVGGGGGGGGGGGDGCEVTSNGSVGVKLYALPPDANTAVFLSRSVNEVFTKALTGKTEMNGEQGPRQGECLVMPDTINSTQEGKDGLGGSEESASDNNGKFTSVFDQSKSTSSQNTSTKLAQSAVLKGGKFTLMSSS